MAEEEKTNLRLEIAHVLFMDIVGYSKLLNDEQREALHELNNLVLNTDAVREAEAAGSLIRLPTGDGMALVFTSSIEAPVECALEISQALRAQPSLPLRMGIHSGSVQNITDVNGRGNVAGSGINIAQRVMDCGDAGHILVSRRVADDLAGSRRWAPLLHDLGECEVKHGVRVSMVNLYADVVGNPVAPAKFGGAKAGRRKLVPGGAARRRPAGRWLLGALALVGLLGFAGWWWTGHSRRNATTAVPTAPLAPKAPGLPVPEKSIAVLPFENLSAEKENAFFTDGVQDEVLTDLSRVADLKVISRASVTQYKPGDARNLHAVGQSLRVAYLVEGSVQRAGGKVRVTAQLVDARSDTQQWAERYDRPLDDVFAIQSEIAENIVKQLRARLSPQERRAIDQPPTTNLAAYDLYLRALNLFRDNTAFAAQGSHRLPQTVGFLQEALAEDPKFLLAWCLLARVQSTIYFQGMDHTPARLEAFHAAVQAAERLAPDAGETHLALADYSYRSDRDYDAARMQLDLARRTLPNNPEIYEHSGYIDRRQGRWSEATRNLVRALELDPRNFFVVQQLALAYEQQHRYADAAGMYQRALTIVPNDPNTRLSLSSLPLDARADTKPYQDTLAALLAQDPGEAADIDDPVYTLCLRDRAAAQRCLADIAADGTPYYGTVFPHAYREGIVARWEGDAPRAQAAFAKARAEVAKVVAAQPNLAIANSLLGMIDAGLGRKAEAITEGRRACELLPIAQDAVDGPAIAANLAQILAWTGEKRAAVEQIAAVEHVPNQLSYGLLKLNPIWDDLRGDPGFDALVATLGPKE